MIRAIASAVVQTVITVFRYSFQVTILLDLFNSIGRSCGQCVVTTFPLEHQLCDCTCVKLLNLIQIPDG